MQSTGQTSTQAVSFVSIQGSVIINGMLASLRNVRDGVSCPAIPVPGGGPRSVGLQDPNRRIIPRDFTAATVARPPASGRVGRSELLSDIGLPQGTKHH